MELFTTVAGGCALVGLALLLRWKKPEWVGTRAMIMLSAGIAALPEMAVLITLMVANRTGKTPGWLQWLITWTGTQATKIPHVGGAAGGTLHVIAASLPWVVAVFFTGWLLLDMYPRLGALRRGGGGGMAGGMGGGRGGGIGTKLAGLNDARPHTMWVALVVPASIALFPPLAQALKIGG